jgi:putative ABC transport system permease protein
MLYELGRLAVSNLLRARARLAMTAGGVLVGTAAVVLLVAITIGLQQAAERGIGQSGALTEISVSVAWDRGGVTDELPQLTPAAVQAFWRIPGVQVVIPILFYQSWGEIRADDYIGGGQIMGIDPQLLPYLQLTAQQGTPSLANEQVMMGSQIPLNFFDPNADPEDGFQPVSIDPMTAALEMRLFNMQGEERRIDLAVSAVLAGNPQFDYSVIVPIQQVIAWNEWVSGRETTAENFRYDMVVIRAADREQTTAISDTIKEMGYSAGGLGEFINQLNGFFSTMRLMLGGVGGVALLVAAFGVANTMTMAILERTREIGLMKAVGASDRDVLTVFLIEAALVGLFGGTAGVALSFFLQNLVNQAVANAAAAGAGQGSASPIYLPIDVSQLSSGLMVIPSELALFGLALATAVGILAGFFPALRAARMTPVMALKTE